MLEFLLHDNNFIFFCTGSIVLSIFVLELIALLVGLDLINIDLPGIDINIPEIVSETAAKRKQKIPLTLAIFSFFVIFTVAGYILQFFIEVTFGSPAPWWIAVLLAIIPTYFSTSVVSMILSSISPKDYSQSVTRDTFINQSAMIVEGEATTVQFAQAKLYDKHRRPHFLRVRLSSDVHDPTEVANAGTLITMLEYIESDNEYLVMM